VSRLFTARVEPRPPKSGVRHDLLRVDDDWRIGLSSEWLILDFHAMRSVTIATRQISSRARSSIPSDALHRFFRKFVERGHSHFDVLFFGVLNLIVTDAAEALDEHHHGGDSGA